MKWPFCGFRTVIFIGFIFCTSSQLLAQLSANVTVDVTEDNGIYTYAYTIENSILSSASVNIFWLDTISGSDVVAGTVGDSNENGEIDDFDREIGIKLLDAPENWVGEYQPFEVEKENNKIIGLKRDLNGVPLFNNTEEVVFLVGNGQDCSDETGDIFEGESLSFTIQSEYGPGERSYAIAKIFDDLPQPDGFGICGGLIDFAEGRVAAPTEPPTVATPACDFDGDGDCDVMDIDELALQIVQGSDDTTFDLNGDGSIDNADVDAFLSHELVNRLNGDTDFNGAVEFADFLVLSNNFGSDGKTWSDGDFVVNGKVEFADFLVFSGNFGLSAEASSAVPEPSCRILLLSASMLIMWSFRNRRC